MRRLVSMVAVLTCVTFAPARAQDYQLVWSDEFDGTSLDLTKWQPQIGTGCPSLCGWGNNELQYYRSENALVGGGFLLISAREESFGGRDYTSARIRSKNLADFRYGRVEMRAKLPTGQGLWPAFWMLPTDEVYGTWAASGEIDIMELVGHEPDRVHGTLHYGGQWPNNVFTGNDYTLPSGTFNDDFHDFALEWEPCEMRWYVDDILYATQTSWHSDGAPYPAPFNERFHLLLNVAVGGNWPGAPDQTTSFPQDMVVDYVRVYQLPENAACIDEFDGMDHNSPHANGWFTFGGTVGGGGIDGNTSDLPPVEGCRASLQTGWGSGGTPGFFGGFGRTFPRDVTDATHFTMWINPDPGQDYVLEINLQDDDNGDNAVPSSPDGADDEFQYNFGVSATGPDAIAGGGWQRVSIPIADFFDDNSFHFGGNGVFDPTPTGAGGNGQLISVVVTVISQSGADVTFRTDRWAFTSQTSTVSGHVFDDLNGNGADDGEPGIDGVTVELYDVAIGAVVETDVTAGGGTYAFDAVRAAAYEVRVDPSGVPAGHVPTHDPDGVGTPGTFDATIFCDETVTGSFGYASPAVSVPGASTSLLRNLVIAPNPASDGVTIRYALAEETALTVAVFDVSGRRVRTLHEGTAHAGVHTQAWDLRDDASRRVSPGVYFAVVDPGRGGRRVERLTVLEGPR